MSSERESGEWGPGANPLPPCSETQALVALAASSAYIGCSDVSWETLVSVLVEEAESFGAVESCFENVVREGGDFEKDTRHNAAEIQGEGEVLRAELQSCLNDVRAAGGSAAALGLAEEITKEEAKVCECTPAFVEALPDCGQFLGYKQAAVRAIQLCTQVPGVTITMPAAGGFVPGAGAGNGQWDRFVPGQGPADMPMPFGPGYDPRAIAQQQTTAAAAGGADGGQMGGAGAGVGGFGHFPGYGPPGQQHEQQQNQQQGGYPGQQVSGPLQGALAAVGPLGPVLLVGGGVGLLVLGAIMARRRFAKRRQQHRGIGGALSQHTYEFGYARQADDNDDFGGTELGAYRGLPMPPDESVGRR